MTSKLWLLLLVSGVACAAGAPPVASPAPPAIAEPAPGEPGAVAGSPGPAEPADEPPAEPAEPGFPGSKWAPRDLGVSVPEAWQACSVSTDCTLVVTTCCDQCNGGKAVAVNGAHAQDAAAKYPKSCNGVACTERGCFTRAACHSGRCTMEWLSAAP